jgi:hypothetical protein
MSFSSNPYTPYNVAEYELTSLRFHGVPVLLIANVLDARLGDQQDDVDANPFP